VRDKPATPSPLELEKPEHPRDFVGLYAKTIPPAKEPEEGEGVVIEDTVNNPLPAFIVVPSKQT
jgi:hypothetical protein